MSSQTDKQLSINFTKDKLSNFYFNKWRGKNIILVFFIFLFSIIISSLVEGSFFEITQVSQLGLKEYPLIRDYWFWALMMLIIPMSYFIRRFNNEGLNAYNRLRKRNVFSKDITEEKYKNFLMEFENKANNRFGFFYGFLFYLLQAAFYVISVISPTNEVYWNDFTFFRLSWIVSNVMFSCCAFMIGLLFWKGYVVVKCVRESSKRFELNLQPLNPDKCAGLQPLGELSFRISALLLFFGLSIVINFTYAYTYILSGQFHLSIVTSAISLSLYIILSLFLFFYPMLSVHNIMSKKKDDLLDQLSGKLGVMSFNFYDELAKKGENIKKDRLEKVLHLRELYLEAGKMPVWPFNTEIFFKFMGTIAFPIILILIEVVILTYA